MSDKDPCIIDVLYDSYIWHREIGLFDTIIIKLGLNTNADTVALAYRGDK